MSDDPPAEWNCGGEVPTTPNPTPNPTAQPSDEPTTPSPTASPSSSPSISPTAPTAGPTMAPTTLEPTSGPTIFVPEAVTVTVDITFDSNPVETGWFITDKNLVNFRVGVPIGAYRPEWGYTSYTSVSDEVELTEGEEYRFTIEDSRGNGMCCDTTPDADSCCSRSGTYKVSLSSGEVLVEGDALFEFSNTFEFTVPLISR